MQVFNPIGRGSFNCLFSFFPSCLWHWLIYLESRGRTIFSFKAISQI
jgi:hypothetical protein